MTAKGRPHSAADPDPGAGIPVAQRAHDASLAQVFIPPDAASGDRAGIVAAGAVVSVWVGSEGTIEIAVELGQVEDWLRLPDGMVGVGLEVEGQRLYSEHHRPRSAGGPPAGPEPGTVHSIAARRRRSGLPREPGSF